MHGVHLVGIVWVEFDQYYWSEVFDRLGSTRAAPCFSVVWVVVLAVWHSGCTSSSIGRKQEEIALCHSYTVLNADTKYQQPQ